jgi:hypothetical protein
MPGQKLDYARPPDAGEGKDAEGKEKVSGRTRTVMLLVVLLLVAWVGTAFVRQHLIASRLEAVARTGAYGSFTPNTKLSDVTVAVPIVPLLMNPFRSHYKAYLLINDSPVAQLTH